MHQAQRPARFAKNRHGLSTLKINAPLDNLVASSNRWSRCEALLAHGKRTKPMRSVKFLIAVGGSICSVSGGICADAPISVPPPPPPPRVMGRLRPWVMGHLPAWPMGQLRATGGAARYGRGLGYGGGSGRGIVDAFDGWYLRGDIGFTVIVSGASTTRWKLFFFLDAEQCLQFANSFSAASAPGSTTGLVRPDW